MTLGETIRQARKNKGISQQQLAHKLFIHPSTLNCIEKGKIVVTSDKILPLCELLDLTPNELFGYKID